MRSTFARAELHGLPRTAPKRVERAGLPDRFTLTGATVQAGGFAAGESGEQIELVDGDAASLQVEEGVPSFGTVVGTWI